MTFDKLKSNLDKINYTIESYYNPPEQVEKKAVSKPNFFGRTIVPFIATLGCLTGVITGVITVVAGALMFNVPALIIGSCITIVSLCVIILIQKSNHTQASKGLLSNLEKVETNVNQLLDDLKKQKELLKSTDLSEEINSLKTKLDEKQQKIDELNKQAKSSVKEVNSLNTKLNEKQQKIDELDKQTKNSAQEVSSLNTKLNEKQHEVDVLNKKLKDSSNELENLKTEKQTEIDQLKQEKKNLDEEKKSLEVKFNQYSIKQNSESNNTNITIENLMNQIKVLMHQLESEKKTNSKILKTNLTNDDNSFNDITPIKPKYNPGYPVTPPSETEKKLLDLTDTSYEDTITSDEDIIPNNN